MDWLGWQSLPINHKNYNFTEKKNNQVVKEREETIQFEWWFKLRLWLVDLDYNFECDWLI